MGQRRDTWREAFTALGQSLIEVLRAELEVIAEAWKRSGKELGIALGLLAAAAYVALVCLPALLIFAGVVGLNAGLGWPLWASALAVAALVTLVVLLIVWIAVKRPQRRCESPVTTVRDRFSDHVTWWNERILYDRKTLGGTDEAQGNDGGDRTAGESPTGA